MRPPYKITALAGCIAGALFCMQESAWAVSVRANNFSAGPIAPNTPLVIELDQFPAPGEGSLALMIGAQDVTGMIQAAGERQIIYPAQDYPLQPGRAEVVLYLAKEGQPWVEVARIPLVVAAASPTPEAAPTGTAIPGGWQFRPKLDVTGPAARKEDRKSGQVESSSTTTDVVGNMQAGLEIERKEEDWAVKASANLAGSTEQTQALRYAQKGNDAYHLDLANYLVEGGFRDTRFALGQITVSGNPLVAGSIANRGLLVTQKINERMDVAISSQNGSTIVGFDRFFGIYDSRNNFTAATLGFEVVPERPRALRVEVSFLDANLKPLQSINASQILSTEQSQGIGVHVLGNSADNRLSGDFAYGLSRYESHADEFTPPTPARTKSAYIAELGYTFLQNLEVRPSWPMTLSAKARREYAQPLYRSLAAGISSDYEQDALTVNTNVAAAQGTLQFAQRRDNVERLATLPQNHVQNVGLNFTFPLAQMILTPGSTTPPNPWWPAAIFGAQRMHQYANNAPPTLPVTSLADIATTILSAGATWTVDRWNWGVTANRNFQDNRQVGASNADIKTLTFNANASWRALDNLTLTASFGPTRTLVYAQEVTRHTYNPQVGFMWTFDPGWSLSGNYNFDRATDSLDLNDTRGYGLNTTVSKSFELLTPWGYTQKGQVSLRHFYNNNTSRNTLNATTFENVVRTNGVVLTLSLNFF